VKVSVSRRCAAAPDVVWAWLADPVRHERTLPGSIVDRSVLPDGNLAGTVTGTGLREQVVMRLEREREPAAGGAGRLVARRIDGGREATTAFELAPADGGTLVTAVAELKLPWLAERLARGPVRSALEEQLANVDRLSAGE
jgi:carbon monoxide dehydrogenase subunit G